MQQVWQALPNREPFFRCDPALQFQSKGSAEWRCNVAASQSLIEGQLFCLESCAFRAAEQVPFNRSPQVAGQRTIQVFQNEFLSVPASQTFTPISAPSAFRARCRWLLTVPSGKSSISATS